MWDELGIGPCNDPKAIRRAYAVRLRQLDPDTDPAGFARLREAFEWALAHGVEVARSDHVASDSVATFDAEPEGSAEEVNDSPEDPTKDHQSPTKHAAAEACYPASTPEPVSDHEDVRDRAVLIALDAAVRRCDAEAAVTLYYRAAATGALSFETAPAALERVLAIAVEERKLDAVAFRRLVRTAGLNAARVRGRFASALQERVLARLSAESWYDELVAAAGQRKGRLARRRAKIARYLLGRIGRYRQPRMDAEALKSWLTQYRAHQAWVDDRIDPAWIAKIERRLRRRQIFWLCFYILFIGGMLINFAAVSAVSVIKGDIPLEGVAIGFGMAVFLTWILKLLVRELLNLTVRRGR